MLGFLYILLLETPPKTQNTSKFTKEQDLFAKWTIDGVQHQFNKNWLARQKIGVSQEYIGPLILEEI